ncbi:MAG: metallophosphoesterase [Clostridiales Family XIII bacterium]|nr:metallophosphoesterase [Clostridiales Family XIII bacterium]
MIYRRTRVFRRLTAALLSLALILALPALPGGGDDVYAKGNLALGDSVKNVLVYVADGSGEEILLARLPVAEMLDYLNDNFATFGKVHNYAILDNFVTAVHQEAQGFTVSQMLDYAVERSAIASAASGWGLGFSGQDSVSFWEIDGGGFDAADTYTYESLYGVPRYNFPALYANFVSGSGGAQHYTDKEAVWESRVSEEVVLSITAFSSRYGLLDGAPANVENYYDDSGLLDTARTVRLMLPQTEDDFDEARPTAMNSRYGITYIRYDMDAVPAVASLGTVAKPTWTFVDGDEDEGDAYEAGYAYFTFVCDTPGATILYNDASETSYMPTAVWDGEPLKVKKLNGKPAVMNIRAVKEGYADAGVVKVSSLIEGEYTEEVSPDADVWDGSVDTSWYVGHEADETYEIDTAAKLAGLSALTNAKSGPAVDFAGKTVKLTRDIHLDRREWMPIGDDMNIGGSKAPGYLDPSKYYTFKGVFDGGGHKVSGINFRNERLIGEGLGFFGYLSGTVKGLTVSGKDEMLWGATASVKIGGIANEALGGALIEDCVNLMELTSNENYRSIAGGICAILRGGVIRGCRNYGKITTERGGGGGIASSVVSASIYSSVNYGRITGMESIGGIAGGGAYGRTGSFFDCENYGVIDVLPLLYPDTNGRQYYAIGGIAGEGVSAEGCVNWVDIDATYKVGGILGKGNTKDCRNYGDINSSNPAGIVYYGNATGCENYGDITGSASAGITHSLDNGYGGYATGCANYGKVVGSGSAAGITRIGTATSCLNAGEITASDAGGVTLTGRAVASVNYGEVRARVRGGGLGVAPSSIESSYNEGRIAAASGVVTPPALGGLAASASGSVEKSFDMTGQPLFDSIDGIAFTNVYYLAGTTPVASGTAPTGLEGRSPAQMKTQSMVRNYLGEYSEDAGGGAGKGNFVQMNEVVGRDGTGLPALYWQPTEYTVAAEPAETALSVEDARGAALTPLSSSPIAGGKAYVYRLLRGAPYEVRAEAAGYLPYAGSVRVAGEASEERISLIKSMVDDARPSEVVLNWAGDPGTTQSGTWTDGSGGSQAVQYVPVSACPLPSPTGGTDPFAILGADARVKSKVATAKTVGANPGKTYYTAALDGLTPGVPYYYRAGKPGRWSDVHTFTTASRSKKESFKFLFLGDVQRNTETADKEYPQWGQLLKDAYARNSDARFGLMAGDMVQSGSDPQDWKYFLSYAQNAFSDIPLMPTIGNHESNFAGGKPLWYLDIFNLPKNGPEGYSEEFYSFDYGSVHVTVLNSWALSSEQGVFALDGSVANPAELDKINRWIEDDLAAASGAKFRVVTLHHPAYPMASDVEASRVRAYWEPLFVDGGVDLALVGHQHVYGRTEPLNDGRVDTQRGVTWVMGNSGLKYYNTADETYWPVLKFETSTYQVISVTGGRIGLKTYDRDGRQLDEWTKASAVPDQPGDVNGDNRTDMDDVAAAKAAALAGGAYDEAYDANGDGKVDIRDAQYILLIVKGAA